MKPYGVIYLAKNRVNGKVYIGQTVNISRRLSKYRQDIKDPRSYFERSLAKNGIDSFEWVVIDKADDAKSLDEREKHWIAHYKSNVKEFGYNQTDGGWANRNCTPECRKTMSEAAKRKFANGYVHHNKGKTPQKHVIEAATAGFQKMLKDKGHPRTGVKLSKEECEKMSKRLVGKHCSPRTEFKSRAILCVELNETFPSLAAAGRKFNKSIGDLCHVLKGKRPTWAGYHWRYLPQDELNQTDSAFPVELANFESVIFP